MSRRGALVAGWLLLAALPTAGRGEEPRGLRVSASGPVWSGGAVTLAVVPTVSLPVSHIQVLVFSGARSLGENVLPTRGGLIRLPCDLGAGRHELRVQSGSLAGRVEVRVLPAGFGPAAVIALIGVLAVAARLAGRRGLRSS